MHDAAESSAPGHFLPKPVLPESLRELVRWLAGDERAALAMHEPKLASTTDLGGLRVLLVEDNPINQQLAVELMESRRVQVDVANNGQEAIEAHQRAWADALLRRADGPADAGDGWLRSHPIAPARFALRQAAHRRDDRPRDGR